MRLYTFRENDCDVMHVGVGNEAGTAVMDIATLGLAYGSMNDLIERASEEEWKQLQEAALCVDDSRFTPLDQVILCAPIPYPKQDMICLGINYLEHAVESARYKEEAFGGERPFAVYFSKRVGEAVTDGGVIPAYEGLVDSLDYEAEFAVVIGKDAKNIAEEDVYDYLLGYTVINDVSARNLQTRHKQWYFGKSLDGFTPMGPCIVTKDQFAWPPHVPVRSYVNGELRQNGNTEQLIFDVAHVVSELSQGMTLKAGTIIATGTPAGAGMGFVPPKFLKKGDVVICEIEGIGRITNVVGD